MNRQTAMVRVSIDTHNRLKRISESEGRSISNIVSRLLEWEELENTFNASERQRKEKMLREFREGKYE